MKELIMANFITQIIKSVCMKCKLSSVIDTFRKWGRLTEDQLLSLSGKRKKTKINMAQTILDLVPKELGLTTDIVGDLELSYMQLHPQSKLWKVFKLTGGGLRLNQDPRTLRARLIRELQSKWKDGIIYGNINCYHGAIWLRIHFDISKRKTKKTSKVMKDYNPNNSVFVLHFQGSPHLIISKTRVKEATLLTRSLIQVFNAQSLSYMQLSDRHVFSLADIAIRKKYETSAQKYKELDSKENPLSCNSRKRKPTEGIFQDTDSITDQNKGEKRLRYMEVEKKFGSDPQPFLQKVEYKFNIGFHGQPATDFNRDCKTDIELKGASVLDGLCQLARKGFMTFPLPKHVTSVISNQRNSFTIVSSKTTVLDN